MAREFISKFKNQIEGIQNRLGNLKHIASSHNKIFELHSKTLLPKDLKNWLTKENIKIVEDTIVSKL